MVAISLTARFSDLNNWPGNLFDARDGGVVVAQTATHFTFRHGASDDQFPGYRIQVTGTGLTYQGGEATGGNITGLRVLDGAGNLVVSFTGFTANTVSSDFSQFWVNLFGSRDAQGDGPNPDGYAAWSHLLLRNDVITGTSGDDGRTLVGLNGGNDRFLMLGGDDQVSGGVGNDTINGGDGFDRLSFRETTYNDGQSAFQGITVNMAAGTVKDCWGGTDRIISIEAIEGSRFNDVFIGDAQRNEFVGLRGRDVFRGGAEQDQIKYDNDHWQGGRRGIVVDLQTSVVNGSIHGTVRDGFGQIDTTYDIERVSGTRYNDTFVGSFEKNVFWGGEGRDSYDGGAGTEDQVRFNRDFVGNDVGSVVIDLTRATGQVRNDGFGNVETMVRIEGFELGGAADTFKGNAADNFVAAREGADLLTGGGGNDEFGWYGDYDIQQRDRITDFNASGAASAVDKLAFYSPDFDGMTGTLRLVNGTAATFNGGQFVYNAANDTLYWDPDGTGSDAAIAVVKLDNVASLSAANFDIWT
jgi:serralysin